MISKNTNIMQRESTIPVVPMNKETRTILSEPQYNDFMKFDRWAALVVRILTLYKPLYWNISKNSNEIPNSSNVSRGVAPINAK